VAKRSPRRQPIESLRTQLARRTPVSGALWAESQGWCPRGEISAARRFDPWPFYAVRGEGACIWDVDGSRYSTAEHATGVLLLGHAPTTIAQAVGEPVAGASLRGAARHGDHLRREARRLHLRTERIILSASMRSSPASGSPIAVGSCCWASRPTLACSARYSAAGCRSG
jgi:4-aminobutyrate aminotransferase-like enzyme